MKGRLVLRKSHAGWSSGTIVCRRGPQDEGDTATVSPWGHPDVMLTVPVVDLVVRRPGGGPVRPARELPKPKKKTRPVFSTANAAEAARKVGLARPVENVVAERLSAGDAFPNGRALIVRLDETLVAVVQRSESPLSRKKAFLIVGVRATKAA
jgi:hypothetical protein